MVVGDAVKSYGNYNVLCDGLGWLSDCSDGLSDGPQGFLWGR